MTNFVINFHDPFTWLHGQSRKQMIDSNIEIKEFQGLNRKHVDTLKCTQLKELKSYMISKLLNHLRFQNYKIEGKSQKIDSVILLYA